MSKTPAKPPSGGAGQTQKKTPSSSHGGGKNKGKKNPGGGKGGSQKVLKQPPFSAQSNLIFPMQGGAKSDLSQTLKKGYLAWDKTKMPPAYSGASQPAYVNFQYNPSTISYSSSAFNQPAAQAAQAFQNPSVSTLLTTPMGQTLSFDLLFNRVFEVQGAYHNDGTPKNNGGVMDAHTHGCWVDILAMEQMTGQLSGDNGTGKNNKPAPPRQNNVNSTIVYQGPSFLIHTWCVLGADDTALYYGYVSDWSYQIAAWTQFMIPMTCVISVTFTLLPYNDAGSPTQGNSSTSLIPPGQKSSGGAGHRVNGTPPGTGNPQQGNGTTTGRGGR